jgi:plastocyanin
MAFFKRLSVVTAIVLAAACGSQPSAPATTAGGAGAPTGKPVDAATAGSLSGRVVFEGTPPAPEMIRMSSDRACMQNGGATQPSDAVLVAADGGLQNVFVWIKDGLDPSYGFAVPAESVVLDQKDCMYRPRVLGVRVGQTLEIKNDDATLHNMHALPMINQEFNQGLPMQGMHLTHVFDSQEVMVRFTCNVHSWMTAWVGVVSHPYFAVTDDTGRFEIKNLPPGTYTLEAWHEKFGTRTAQVTVADHQAQTASFTFTADSK